MKYLTSLLLLLSATMAPTVRATDQISCFEEIENSSRDINFDLTNDTEIDEYFETSRVIRSPQYTFDVCFHVIHSGDSGHVSENALREQIQEANRGFAGLHSKAGINSGISFQLKSVDYTDNDEYFRRCAITDVDKKYTPELHVPYCVNVYTCSMALRIGLATMPYVTNPFTDTYRYGKEDDWRLNVKLTHEVIPGQRNTNPYFNKGRIFIHEMGHFLGLFHLYNGGCAHSEIFSDNITDTPIIESNVGQATCDTSLRSCGNRAPVHNYMLATRDTCRYMFTPGQIERMRYVINKFKKRTVKSDREVDEL